MRGSLVLLLALGTVAACGVAEFTVEPALPTPTPTPTPGPTPTPPEYPPAVATPVPTSTAIVGELVYGDCTPIARAPSSHEVVIAGPSAIAPGTAVLLHQTQDRLTTGEQAGRYDLGVVAVVTSAGAAEVILAFPGPFGHLYGSDATDRRAQLCIVPYFDELQVPDGVILRASKWDGVSGGILPFRANSLVVGNASIQSASSGFRGGVMQAAGTPGGTGEGLQVALPTPTPTPNIGGVGGGESSGSAGGGGGGAGAGGAGSGTSPGANGVARTHADGFAPFGGGGGGGNLLTGMSDTEADGGAGGGFLFIEAAALTSTSVGRIEANGRAGGDVNGSGETIAGGGGGGAGGTVVLRGLAGGELTCTFPTPFQIRADGADGGAGIATTLSGGGGGGGGAVLGACTTVTGVAPTYSAKGGQGGDGTATNDGAPGVAGAVPVSD